MIIAYHLVWTAYGWWLPNDPRGSGSQSVRNDWIAELGDLHFGRKRVQPLGRAVHDFYQLAAGALKHPLLTFDEASRAQIALAFDEVVKKQNYTCYACAIMPDHVHVLIRRHKHCAEEMTEHLQSGSLERLIVNKLRPIDHPVWTGGDGWKVFLDYPAEIRRTIRYIEENPIKIGLPAQRWPFVKPYDGWPKHKRNPEHVR